MKYKPYELKPRSGKYVAVGHFRKLDEAFNDASTLARETMHRVELRDRDGKLWCGFDFNLGSKTNERNTS